MTRQEILAASYKCICGDRELNYGSPRENLARAAKMVSAYLDHDVNEHDIAMILALVKISRIASGIIVDDNYIDLAGYAAIAGELSREDNGGESI